MTKYSIILPVKNGGAYIKECVNSILEQTYANFTLHVLDNCSTDDTGEWIRSLTDERIIYLPSATPLSIEESWGRIKDIPKNEFITLIGHDDVLLPYYLETMDKLITANPGASLYQTHFKYIDSTGSVIKPCKPMQEEQDGPGFLKNFLTNNVDIMGTGFMMRSKDYDSLGGIPVQYPNLLFADMELWLRLTAINYLCISPLSCFQYRIHMSTTKTTSDLKLINALEQMILFLAVLKNENDRYKVIVEENCIAFIQHHCVSFSHRVLRTPYEKREGINVKQIVQKCRHFAKLLKPGDNYNPGNSFQIRIAKCIDSNIILLKSFLFLKKIKRGAFRNEGVS